MNEDYYSNKTFDSDMMFELKNKLTKSNNPRSNNKEEKLSYDLFRRQYCRLVLLLLDKQQSTKMIIYMYRDIFLNHNT